MSIATGRRVATVQASVGLDLVAIIALFITRLVSTPVSTPKTITTSGFDTRDAPVVVIFIAIVTGLVAVLTRLPIRPANAIAACGELARVGAFVAIDIVLVVTVLAFIDDAITAVFRAAVRRTAIPTTPVSIIALFPVFPENSNDTITTGGPSAIIPTFVVLGFVTIIAVLAGANDPVTADASRAIVTTRVGLILVAVVAGFKARFSEF